MLYDKISEPIKNFFSKNEEELDKNTDIIQLPNVSEPEAIEVDENNLSWGYSFDIVITNIKQLVKLYRNAALNFEVENAVDEIVNEAIVMDEDAIVEINLDNVDLSEATKKKVKEEFKTILQLLDFNNAGDEIFRKWYVDGRIYYQNIVNPKRIKEGIKKLKLLSPLDIARYKDKETKKKFFVWRMDEEEKARRQTLFAGFMAQDDAGNKIWKVPAMLITFAPSGITDPQESYYISHIHKVLKPLNQLKLIEDSAIIYRLTRAPERRVFNIDVGRLGKKKAEAYVKKIIRKFKNKITYDSGTGELSQKRNTMTLLEDFYFPKNAEGKGTTVDVMQSGSLVDKIEDLQYFKKKLYKSLKVPTSRIDIEDKPMFDIGRSGEISREDLKFTKFVNKLRSKIAKYLFLDILRKQLIFKNIMSANEWEEIKNDIYFDWTSDSYITQLKEDEILTGRVELAEAVDEFIGKYFSKTFVRKNILRQSDDDIKRIDEEIAEEEKEGDDEEVEQPNPNEQAVQQPQQQPNEQAVQQP